MGIQEMETKLPSFEIRQFMEDPLSNNKAKYRGGTLIRYGNQAVESIKAYLELDSNAHADGMFWLWWGETGAQESTRVLMPPVAAELDFERHAPKIMTNGNVCYTMLFDKRRDWIHSPGNA
jgi:hypothetical protein